MGTMPADWEIASSGGWSAGLCTGCDTQ